MQHQQAACIATFHTTPHWGQRQQAQGARTPVEVLGWLRGRAVDPKRLRQLFGRAEFLRTINRYGFVSVQRFSMYAESGLSRQRVSIWSYEGQWRMEDQKTLLAQYRCTYDLRKGHLHEVSEPILYATPFASPQLALIELDDEQWRKFQRRPSRNSPKRIAMLGQQLSLLDLGTSARILWALKAI